MRQGAALGAVCTLTPWPGRGPLAHTGCTGAARCGQGEAARGMQPGHGLPAWRPLRWPAYYAQAPAIFSGLWRVVSPFIDPVTRQKIHFVSSCEEILAEVRGVSLCLGPCCSLARCS